jgi:hypothetical protein
MKEIIARFLAVLQKQNISTEVFNVGCSDDDLISIEEKIGLVLMGNTRDLYSCINGYKRSESAGLFCGFEFLDINFVAEYYRRDQYIELFKEMFYFQENPELSFEEFTSKYDISQFICLFNNSNGEELWLDSSISNSPIFGNFPDDYELYCPLCQVFDSLESLFISHTECHEQGFIWRDGDYISYDYTKIAPFMKLKNPNSSDYWDYMSNNPYIINTQYIEPE